MQRYEYETEVPRDKIKGRLETSSGQKIETAKLTTKLDSAPPKDRVHELNVDSEICDNHPTLSRQNSAATKIQAGYKGIVAKNDTKQNLSQQNLLMNLLIQELILPQLRSRLNLEESKLIIWKG
jgi:hypothetical protein